MRYGRRSCNIYSRCSMWFPCFSKQLLSLRRTEVRTLSKISRFVRISSVAFSARCCNTSKSLTGAGHTKVFRCPQNRISRGIRSGDSAGQLTGPARPVHCSPKAWFWCCLNNAENMRWCPILHEPHELSLMKRHMFQLANHFQKTTVQLHVLVC
jgi:hypothetical protein